MRDSEADSISLEPREMICGGEVHNFVGVQEGAARMPNANEKTENEKGIDPEIPGLVE